MKKVYILACAALISASAMAQSILPMQKEKMRDMRLMNQNATPQVASDREVFYTNDFSEPTDWLIDNALDNGFTQFVDLQFEVGSGLAPEGPAAINVIASTTADNGFAMVDSDEYGGEEGGTGVENCWIQTVNPINCMDHPFVSIAFENQYYMWDNGSSDGNEYCLLEVSTDGVTWPDVETFEVSDAPSGTRFELWPSMGTQDAVMNPTVKTFEISELAGGNSTVYLRFRWKGTWGYAWMIDDIELFDTPANDLRVDAVSYSDYDNTGLYEYGVYAASQVTEMTFRADISNIGVQDQNGVNLQIDINGTNELQEFAAEAVAAGTTDSLIATGYTPPMTPGTYDIDFIIEQDEEDENPLDNVDAKSFAVSEFQYGRDNGEFTGVFPGDGTEEWIAGPLFQIFDDVTVYAIDVAFMDASSTSADVIAELRDAESDAFDPVSASSEQTISPAYVNDGASEPVWQTFVLDDPIEYAAGSFVFPTIQHYGGENVQIGESINAPDQTCFVYGAFPDFDWYYTNEIPMVRLNLDENAVNSIDEVSRGSFTLFQNVPNPAESNTRIAYELQNSERVTLDVYDLMGKHVMSIDEGKMPVGTHLIEMNVSDLSSGMYQYTLTVGNDRMTRKMIVK